MSKDIRRVAVIGGNRIPFARSNTVYANVSNQDMLTAAIDGLVARYGLEGERLGEVVAGAVLKHARDFNLARESVLGSKLSPETPATDIQQACGTGLQQIGQDVSEVLDYEPGSFKVIRHIRPTFACAQCLAVTQALAPRHWRPGARWIAAWPVPA